jgi:hypothetical protein
MNEPRPSPPETLTPIAEEILADLRRYFRNGSTRRELAEWLGGSKSDTVAALTELLRLELVVKGGTIYRVARGLQLQAA